MHFNVLTLAATLSALATGVLASTGASCGSCVQAPSSDCSAAYDQIPSSGSADGRGDNLYYTSGNCEIAFYPNGADVDFTKIQSAASDMISSCCDGNDSCSASYLGGDLGAGTGCMCIMTPDSDRCQCETNDIECIGA